LRPICAHHAHKIYTKMFSSRFLESTRRYNTTNTGMIASAAADMIKRNGCRCSPSFLAESGVRFGPD